ncbi:MAG: squalene synthase HpnC [Acidimicrobiales bacterium]
MEVLGARVTAASQGNVEGPRDAVSNPVLAKARDENFSVAPLFLPRPIRAQMLALYGFARFVDDLGDEADGDRLALLDWAEAELDRAAAGHATHPIFRRLTPTIQTCRLDLQPFRDLIQANRIDQTVHAYQTFDDLLGYCALSANPVGRLVLALLDMATPERVRWSDDVCSALQVAEHCQDVAEDAAQGRVYLPAADLAYFGCDPADLNAPVASSALRGVLRLEVGRARGLLASSVPLAASLHGRARLLIAGFAAGGGAALDAIEGNEFNVMARPCPPSRARTVTRTLRLLMAAREARPR